MISDLQTNTVYLADSLFPSERKKFQAFLESNGVKVKILKGTEDYYCRDYMPVQVGEKEFIQFVFKPDYYDLNEVDLITNPLKVIIANKLGNIRYSKIILDGGNFVKWKDKVIITDKVLKDNRSQFNNNDDDIINQLEKELKCRVLIIPADPEDKVGHSDGMVRFIDKSRVFVNDPLGGTQKWQQEFRQKLKEYILSPVSFPCTMEHESADGLYINYLHVENLIVVPQFGKKHKDEEAFRIIEREMGKQCNVVKYDARKISKNGGGLNCATWTVRE